MTNEQRRTVWFRAGQLLALLAMALLGVVDLMGGMIADGVRLFVGPVQVVLSLATAAVWWPQYRHNSRTLPVLAVLLAGTSLAITFLLVVFDTSGASWGVAEALGLGLVMMAVARRGQPAWAVPAAAACLVAVAAQPLRNDLGNAGLVLGMLQALLGTGALAMGAYQRVIVGNRERALIAVRAEQRTEFARDLHDFIAHHVTGIVVQAQGARFIAENDPHRVITALEQIERAGGETMSAMRRMVGVLRDHGTDAPLAPLTGMADLSTLVEGFSGAGGPPVRLNLDGVRDDLPVDISSTAYRVVMEALTNVRQHAPEAEAVDVWVRQTPDWLLIRVANGGPTAQRSGPQRERAGYGLVGLEERLTAIGGRLQAGPGIAGGWVVDAALPLTEEGAR